MVRKFIVIGNYLFFSLFLCEFCWARVNHYTNDEVAIYAAPEWAQQISNGGRGGRIVRVTTLDAEGPGSLRTALSEFGKRVVVFEVGGIVDLRGRDLIIRHSNVTIAGQTAPSPGITVIGGSLRIRADDVVVQHLRLRPGDMGGARLDGGQNDGLSVIQSRRVVIDHCSLSWAVDENASVGGPPFLGVGPTQWRQNTSGDVLFSNNIVGEGLSKSTHPKGPHSMGLLVHENVRDVVVLRNLFISNVRRNPVLKGGTSSHIINNLIYNPGKRAIHFAMRRGEWSNRIRVPAEIWVIGNVFKRGPSTAPETRFFEIEDESNLSIAWTDNIEIDGGQLISAGIPERHRKKELNSPLSAKAVLNKRLIVVPAFETEAMVLGASGARPWDRDVVDKRLVAEARSGGGRVIDSQEDVGGYPRMSSSKHAFSLSKWDWRGVTLMPVEIGEQRE